MPVCNKKSDVHPQFSIARGYISLVKCKVTTIKFIHESLKIIPLLHAWVGLIADETTPFTGTGGRDREPDPSASFPGCVVMDPPTSAA